MSNAEDSRKLRAALDYLQELFDQRGRRELQVVIRLLNQELARAGTPVDEPAAQDGRPGYSLPEPEDEPVSAEDIETGDGLTRTRDRERLRRRRAQMRLEQLVAERVQSLKSDVLRCEENRLEALDRKENELAQIDSALQKIDARHTSIRRHREQTFKEEQTLREELGKRQKLVKEDRKALEELREHVARLRRELDTAVQRQTELDEGVARNLQRMKNEETALAEIQNRRQRLDETEAQSGSDAEALRLQRETLQRDYEVRFVAFEEEFLRKHWSTPPISGEHLKEALKASAIVMDADQQAVRAKLESLGLAGNLTVATPVLDAGDLGAPAPEPNSAHASLQSFLKLVKS